MEPTFEELLAALARPDAFPHPVDRVEVIHTHVSAILLAGERAYKLRKPVDLGFLDFSTAALRRQACEAELRLNAELAPGVYLRVVDVVRGRDGTIRIGGEGEVLDAVVEMQRLPAAGMLDRRLEAGLVDNALIGELAALLARFHAGTAHGPGVDEHGAPDRVAFNVRENFAQTTAAVGDGSQPGHAFTARLHTFLAARAERFLEQNAGLLAARARGGRIREGHGDLHAGNVCVREYGIVVYDRIEFAARLRCCDVAADLAFLAMDLDDRGFRGFSQYLVRRYGEESGDRELGALLPFYKGYRAMVRAKVACFAAADPALGPVERERRQREARRYASLAASYELPPALVLVCGLPASGKSTFASAIARPFEALVLASDVRRRRLAGVPARGHRPVGFGEGIYSRELSARTYDSLLAGAGEALGHGRTVIVDASFAQAVLRAPFLELARSLAVPALVVLVEAAEPLIRERLAARAADPDAVSDADVAVFEQVRQRFEPPGPAERAALLTLHSPCEAELAALRALDALVALVR